MLGVLGIVLFSLVFFAGIGLPFARRLILPTPETLLAAFFIGWGLALAVLQVWNFFLPVNLLAFALAGIASLAGWAFASRPGWRWLRTRPPAQVLGLGAAGLLLLYLLANQSLHSVSTVDHGLYHLPMVRWIEEYRIVPGLVNLHHRFGFNNSSFLVVALQKAGPWHEYVYYTATTTLFSALGLRGLLGAYRVTQGVRSLRDVFHAFFLPATLYYITQDVYTYAGYATDTVVYVLQVFLAGELLHAFTQSRTAAPRAARAAQIALIVFIAAVGVSVKLSFAVYAAGVILAALWAWFRHNPADRAVHRAALLRWAGIAALVIVPWLGRGVVLSGYPFYPSPLISLPVPWKAPLDMVEPVAGIISQWARSNGALPVDVPFGEWFVWWFPQQPWELKEALAFTLMLLVGVVVLRRVGRTPLTAWHGPVALLVVSLAAWVFWFLVAPTPRFAGAVFFLLPAAAALLLYRVGLSQHWLNRGALVAGGMLLALLWLRPEFTNNVTIDWLLLPPPESQLSASLRTFPVDQFATTESGLRVYIGSDKTEDLCLDAPLPCTRRADLHPRLSLLRPGDLTSGFFIASAE